MPLRPSLENTGTAVVAAVNTPALQGFSVAVTADRRRQEQAVLLRRQGAEVLEFPLLRTEPEPSDNLGQATAALVASPPAYLLANTGYGMRTWLELARQDGTLTDLLRALGATYIAARGAKALGELRRVGLDAAYKAPAETLEETVAHLEARGLDGASVVVQLHGEPPGELARRLEAAGARATYLSVYRMGEVGAAEAAALVEDLVEGGLDAVTFTAAPQVQALASVARELGAGPGALEAFNAGGVVAACIGEVCAAAGRAWGIENPLVPEHPRLGSLAHTLGAELTGRRRQLEGNHGAVVVSGARARTAAGELTLDPGQRRLLRPLLAGARSHGHASAPGALRARDAEDEDEDEDEAMGRLAALLDEALEKRAGGWALRA